MDIRIGRGDDAPAPAWTFDFDIAGSRFDLELAPAGQSPTTVTSADGGLAIDTLGRRVTWPLTTMRSASLPAGALTRYVLRRIVPGGETRIYAGGRIEIVEGPVDPALVDIVGVGPQGPPGLSSAPGGATSQVQYNSGGSLAGAAGVTTDGANLALANALLFTGSRSLPAWGLSGARIGGGAGTLTDTSSPAGVVASAASNRIGGDVIAAANAITVTDAYSAWFVDPAAGANVTLTNRWSLGLAGRMKASGVTIAGVAGASALAIDGATQTSSNPLISGAQTWNGAGVVFAADRIDVTDAASAAGSLLIDRRVGGASRFSVDKAGVGAFAGGLAAPAVTLTPQAGASALVIAGATQTTSAPLVDAVQTWNASGVVFTAERVNVTDAGSAAGSLLLDRQVGGVSKFRVDKTGLAYSAGGFVFSGATVGLLPTSGAPTLMNTSSGWLLLTSTQAYLSSSVVFGWGNSTSASGASADTFLGRAAAASIRLGVADAAAPVAQTLGVQNVAGIANTAGVNFTIRGAAGTGTGAGGSLLFSVAPAGSTGSAQNAFATALTIASDKSATFTGKVVSNAAAGVGYATGAGGTATQTTSKATGVTLNAACGQITLAATSLAASTAVSFTLTNSVIAAGDVLILNHASAGTAGAYALNAQAANGSALISVRNLTAGALAEGIVIAFAVIKGATA